MYTCSIDMMLNLTGMMHCSSQLVIGYVTDYILVGQWIMVGYAQDDLVIVSGYAHLNCCWLYNTEGRCLNEPNCWNHISGTDWFSCD